MAGEPATAGAPAVAIGPSAPVQDRSAGTGSAVTRTGRTAIVEQLLADGIRYIFGNPGTVEEGLLDSLSDPRAPQYILALHETVALAMADAYARATKRPAVVQLHSGVGLGNGVGMLYQANRGHSPLVVLAGDAGLRYEATDAQMAADLVGIARPVTKWAGRVTHPASLLRMLRRAIKIASTPPCGPVFLALPMDVLDAPAEEAVVPTPVLATGTAPDATVIDRAAALLAPAERPLIIVGDGVAVSGAQPEVARVAELLGAPVWGADASEVNMSASHPHFRGMLGHMFGEQSRAITAQADAVLICGTYVFPEVFPSLDGAFAPGARLVHIDLNAYEIAKNFPVDLGIVGDPKSSLGLLAAALDRDLTPAQMQAARMRSEELAREQAAEDEAARAADRLRWGEMPLHASRFMSELADLVPHDVVVFDEALTTSPDLTRYLPPTEPGTYFLTRGGSLGVGIPGALGLKLAHPDRTVFGFGGDGGAMYTIQALWTAAHHDIGAKLVICNNASYRILKVNIQHWFAEQGIAGGRFPACFDLHGPELRFDLLAQAMGVPAVRVETEAQIRPAIEQALATKGPFLIDVRIDGEVAPDTVHVKCGQ
ncbi:MAG: benzoylformate decarboxylase [Chloroflexota bacterium]|jgi:benzoylformate decarboxylase|nr:benzoylformate decarboxylase [Chloroflexota bacterium]